MRIPWLMYACFGLLIMGTCVGCTHMHRVVNTGDSMLYAVTIQSGDRKFGHGYLPPKATKVYSGSMRIMRVPAPVVSWKTSEEGEPTSQEVDLDVDPGTREVVLEIDGKTVKGVVRDK